MDRHQWVVGEQRIRPAAIGCRDEQLRERIRRANHESEEERAGAEQHGGRPPDDRVGPSFAVFAVYGEGEPGEDQTPQQDRSFQRAPHAGDGVEQGSGPRVVVDDVGK